MKRLGLLALELGWPIEKLLAMPANKIEELQIVRKAVEDYRSEINGSNHSGSE